MSSLLRSSGATNDGLSVSVSTRFTGGPETCRHSKTKSLPSGSTTVASTVTLDRSATTRSSPRSMTTGSLSALMPTVTTFSTVVSPSDTSSRNDITVPASSSGAMKDISAESAPLIATLDPDTCVHR